MSALSMSYEVRLTHLLFTQKGKMKKNLQWLRVCRQDDKFSDTAIQGFRRCRMIGLHYHPSESKDIHTFIGPLFKLFISGSLLNKIEDLNREKVRFSEGVYCEEANLVVQVSRGKRPGLSASLRIRHCYRSFVGDLTWC